MLDIRALLQSIFGLFGYHVSKRERGANPDSSLTEQFRLLGSDVSCIFEVGAANGRDTAMYADKFPRATVHAFEPLPVNFKSLAERAAQNPRIVAVNSAVSDAIGSAEFHVTNLPDASSLFAPRETGSTFDRHMTLKETITTDVTTLDEYIRKNHIEQIDLLKMDAQGAELKILQGAHKSLESNCIKLIYSEVLFMDIYSGSAKWFEIASFLYQFGFRLHGLYNLNHNQNAQLAWGDAIFTRQEVAK